VKHKNFVFTIFYSIVVPASTPGSSFTGPNNTQGAPTGPTNQRGLPAKRGATGGRGQFVRGGPAGRGYFSGRGGASAIQGQIKRSTVDLLQDGKNRKLERSSFIQILGKTSKLGE